MAGGRRIGALAAAAALSLGACSGGSSGSSSDTSSRDDGASPTTAATPTTGAPRGALSVRVAYVGFASAPGGTGLVPANVDVRVGSDPLNLPAPVVSGVPGPFVTDPVTLAVGDVGYEIGPTDGSSDMRRYQGSTSGLDAGDEIVVATLRLPTGGDVTTVRAADLPVPATGRATLGVAVLWPDGSAVRLRAGLSGEGCLDGEPVSGGPFSRAVPFDVAPGRLELALYAEADTACSAAPVIGPSLVGVEMGRATLAVGWRADDVNKGFLPVPLAGLSRQSGQS